MLSKDFGCFRIIDWRLTTLPLPPPPAPRCLWPTFATGDTRKLPPPTPTIIKHQHYNPDMEQELTIASVGDLSKFPLLDSFHWEILRMFPAPPFFFKVSALQ